MHPAVMVTATKTDSDIISLNGYYIIQWVFFAFCAVACAARTYIRFMCFHRLFAEDWLMLLALACHLSITVVGQVLLANMYESLVVKNGAPMEADFLVNVPHSIHIFGIILLLSVAGIWLVKLSFLLFFYRLGSHMAKYRIWWWTGLVFNLGCGVGCFALFQYRCLFGSVDQIFGHCAAGSGTRASYIRVAMTAVLDIVSDIAILCFPAYILWTVKITLRKKLILSAVFGMVGFTIAIASLRGSKFSGGVQFKNASGDSQTNITWITFWWLLEFTISYMIACIVSFRALFVRSEPQSGVRQAAQRQQQSEQLRAQGIKQRMLMLHDSMLDICRNWEGHLDASSLSTTRVPVLPQPPSGRLSVDFSSGISSV